MISRLKNRSPRFRLEHILFLAFLVFALMAGGGLFFLKTTHDRQARLAATENVLHRGVSLLNTLSTLGSACSSDASPELWRQFSVASDNIFAVRPDVQSLSIMRDGVTLFHRQSHGMDPAAATTNRVPVEQDTETVLSRGTLEVGGVFQPVFVLSKTLRQPDGRSVIIEATLKREAVGVEEQTARRVVLSLFIFSMIVLALSFASCAGVLILAVLRDRKRELRARQEEHLAFSGVLANGILHDFRNPMSAVRLDAQMLEREMTRPESFRPERVTELAGRIARAMGRMDKVFQEFLFLAKPADEKPERISLEHLVKECVETLAPRLEQAGVTIHIQAPPDLPGASAYPFALRRAFLNVLMNAIQFAPRESVIDILLSHDAQHVVAEIQDRGPGIPADQRAQIFEMFVTTRPEGTGLGLFLARTAIQRCEGSIEALPRVGGGTVMKIVLKTL